LRVPGANPYVAGALALLVCVVLGNLGTPAVFLTGVVRAGGCAETPDMLTWQTQRFVAREGRQPTPPEDMNLYDAAESPSISDQVAYRLETARQSLECLGRGIGQAFGGGWLPVGPERWFWGPRSIITELPGASNEINEFPIFTFIFGDLHAHMIALPLTLLALAWLAAEILGAGVIRRPAWVVIGATLLGGLVVGILRPTNTWDWITYLLLGAVGLVFVFFRRGDHINRENLLGWGGVILLFLVTHVVVVLPFTAFFSTAYTSVVAFEGMKTPLWAYMTMHGIFLFVILSLLVWQTARLLRLTYVRDFVGRSALARALVVTAVVTAAVTLFLAFMPIRIFILDLPAPLALLTVPLMVWCALLIVIPEQPREWQIVYGMIALAMGISLGVEFVVLGGDIGRQNTFFKFYMQVWILLSVASGVGLAWLLYAARGWQPGVRAAWQVLIAALLAVAGLFPITATQGRNQMRMAPSAPNTLDGDDYMAQAVYYSGATPIPLGTDLKLIHWLQDNVQGTPVVLEGREPGSEYKYNGRIAINTGLPTILGWRFHQVQQRTLDPLPNLVNQRESNVNTMYNSPDVAITWRMLQFYHVEYIVVSDLEKMVYTASGLAKFDTMVNLGLLDVAYETDGARIYHVVPGAKLQDVLVGMAETP
ncbi:MAG: hypothetical protein IT323_00795, partial [Anaerolineae bacterium]|nr:hypothetical protein [Anaerolineae bacterium]